MDNRKQSDNPATDAASLWAAYCASDPEKKAVVDFILLDAEAEPPAWTTYDCRLWRDALFMTVCRWLSNPPKPKLKLVYSGDSAKVPKNG